MFICIYLHKHLFCIQKDCSPWSQSWRMCCALVSGIWRTLPLMKTSWAQVRYGQGLLSSRSPVCHGISGEPERPPLLPSMRPQQGSGYTVSRLSGSERGFPGRSLNIFLSFRFRLSQKELKMFTTTLYVYLGIGGVEGWS